MRKTLRNVVTGAVALAGAFAPTQRAEAQGNVTGNVEYIQAKDNKNAYGRLNVFYNLPAKINGFTFIELYKKNGYFGRTILDRAIDSKGGLGARVIDEHLSEPVGDVGIGVTQRVSFVPKGTFANISLMPTWFDKHGKEVKNKSIAQYFFTTGLPGKLNLSGFGEWNLAAENGPQWGYGEFLLSRNFGNAFVGYEPALVNKGNAAPKVLHRATIGVNFGGKK